MRRLNVNVYSRIEHILLAMVPCCIHGNFSLVGSGGDRLTVFWTPTGYSPSVCQSGEYIKYFNL